MGILDAPALTLTGLKKLAAPGLLPNPVVNVTGNIPVTFTANGGNRTYQNTTTIPMACAEVQLVFAFGVGLSLPSGIGVTKPDIWAQASTIGCTITIQNPTTALSYQKVITFNGGETTFTMGPYVQSVVSDPLNLHMPPSYITIQTYILGAADRVLNGAATGVPGNPSTGDGYSAGDTRGSTAAAGTLNQQYPGALPIYVTGRLITPAPIWVGVGDSILSGAGDGGTQVGGWFMRGLNNGFPVQRISLSGLTAEGMSTTGDFAFNTLCGNTHGAVMMGTNDIKLNNKTFAEVTGYLSNLYLKLKRRGIKTYGCTILPCPIGGAGYTPGGTRSQVNAWIRAGGGGLLDGHLETADAVESARDSNVWAGTAGQYTGDNIHPNAAGHALIAASAFNPASYTV